MMPEKELEHQTEKQALAVMPAPHKKNPRRVAAGRLNRRKRRGLTEAGRRRLRENAFKHRPWQHATGPRSAEGKAKASKNGCWRQRGGTSKRQLRAAVQQALAGSGRLAELRQLLGTHEPALDNRPDDQARTAWRI